MTAAPDLGIARALVEARRANGARVAPPSPPPQAAPRLATDAPAGSVIERQLVTPELLVIRLSKPGGFRFTPGQSVKLAIGDASHKYTIASAPGDPYLEFCIELVAGGALTPRLFALSAGDQVRIGGAAKGSLVLDEAASDHLMFATVTGIAPFISMLRHERRAPNPRRRFMLVHGASFADELVYRDELEAIVQSLPDAEYVPVISRPGEPRNRAFQGLTGRLPSVSDQLAERFGLARGHSRVYACGHPAMVEAIAAQFESPDVPVTTESFWRL